MTMDDPWLWWAAQFVGLVALVIGVFGFAQTNDRRLKGFLTLQTLVLALHFALLGVWVAVGTSLLTALRNYISRFAQARILAPFFILAYATIGFSQFTAPWQLLAVLGATLSTLGLFYCTGIRLRLLVLGAITCWLIHNIFAGSIGPSIMEALQWAMNAKTIWVLWRKDAKTTPL